MDERFSHTLSHVHQEGLKTSSDYEAMGESLQPEEELQTSTGTASSASSTISKKSVLKIVLDLNGLLLKHCQQKPS